MTTVHHVPPFGGCRCDPDVVGDCPADALCSWRQVGRSHPRQRQGRRPRREQRRFGGCGARIGLGAGASARDLCWGRHSGALLGRPSSRVQARSRPSAGGGLSPQPSNVVYTWAAPQPSANTGGGRSGFGENNSPGRYPSNRGYCPALPPKTGLSSSPSSTTTRWNGRGCPVRLRTVPGVRAYGLRRRIVASWNCGNDCCAVALVEPIRRGMHYHAWLRSGQMFGMKATRFQDRTVAHRWAARQRPDKADRLVLSCVECPRPARSRRRPPAWGRIARDVAAAVGLPVVDVRHGAHSRFPGHALTPTGVMAIRCKQFHLPDL